MPATKTLEERFWPKVDRRGPDECWPWLAQRQQRRGNYGRFRDRMAHRVAYELHYGVAPGELMVCHTCDNPPCVNPAHLWLGSAAENVEDCIRKGRFRRPVRSRPEFCRKCGHKRTDDYSFRHVSGQIIQRCRACALRQRAASRSRNQRNPDGSAHPHAGPRG